jgi:small subunit ribosomal protein S15
MALLPEQKAEIIGKYGRTKGDTASPEVQAALLTARIKMLTEHFQSHKHDHHSRRGLLKLVGQRRRVLNYLMRHNIEGYRTLIADLGIRK